MATFDATLGGHAATSYVSAATADAYFAGSIHEADWTAIDPDEQLSFLMAATSSLEVLSYNGDRCNPSTTDPLQPQALAWPRSGISCDGVAVTCAAIPRPIIEATCLLALELQRTPNAIIGGSTAVTGPIQSQTLGALSQSFYAPESSQAKVDVSAPLVLQKFPWLVDLIPSCLLASTGSSAKVITRVRS